MLILFRHGINMWPGWSYHPWTSVQVWMYPRPAQTTFRGDLHKSCHIFFSTVSRSQGHWHTSGVILVYLESKMFATRGNNITFGLCEQKWLTALSAYKPRVVTQDPLNVNWRSSSCALVIRSPKMYKNTRSAAKEHNLMELLLKKKAFSQICMQSQH